MLEPGYYDMEKKLGRSPLVWQGNDVRKLLPERPVKLELASVRLSVFQNSA